MCWPDAYPSIFPDRKSIKYTRYRKTFLIVDIIAVLIAVASIATFCGLLIEQQQTDTDTNSRIIINHGTIKTVNITCDHAQMCTIITDYRDDRCINRVSYSNVTIYKGESTFVQVCGSNDQDDGPIIIYGIPTGTPLELQSKLVTITFSNGKSRYLPPINSGQVNNLVISETRIRDETADNPLIAQSTKFRQEYEPQQVVGESCSPMGNNPYVFAQTLCGWKRLTLEDIDLEVVTTMKTSIAALFTQMMATFIIWAIVGAIVVWSRRLFLYCNNIDAEGDDAMHIHQRATVAKTNDLETGTTNPDVQLSDFRKGGSGEDSSIVRTPNVDESTVIIRPNALNHIDNCNSIKSRPGTPALGTSMSKGNNSGDFPRQTTATSSLDSLSANFSQDLLGNISSTFKMSNSSADISSDNFIYYPNLTKSHSLGIPTVSSTPLKRSKSKPEVSVKYVKYSNETRQTKTVKKIKRAVVPPLNLHQLSDSNLYESPPIGGLYPLPKNKVGTVVTSRKPPRPPKTKRRRRVRNKNKIKPA